MADLNLNSDFSVHLDDRNDLAYTEGRKAFEQAVVISLTDYLYNQALDERGFQNQKKAVKLQVSRVARRYDEIENIKRINIQRSTTTENALEVDIVFDTGEPLTFEVDS